MPALHRTIAPTSSDAARRALKRSRVVIGELAEPDANITVYRPRSHPRVYGAFCQRWCDFHVHELDGPGGVVRLEALPSEPPELEASEYVHFVLCKENRSTAEALQELASAAGVSPRAFGFRGSKDRRAITTQRVSARGVAPARLLKVNAKWTSGGSRVRIGHLRAAESALSLGEAAGNKFSIVLREVAIDDDEAHTGETPSVEAACVAAADAVATNGFVNYFGLQRFGRDAEVPTHAVGAAMLRRDWMGALLLVLAPTAPGLSPPARAALEAFAANRDARASLRLLPARKCATARRSFAPTSTRAGRCRGRRRGGGGGGGGGGGAADAAAAQLLLYVNARRRCCGIGWRRRGCRCSVRASSRATSCGRSRRAAAAERGGCEEEEEEGVATTPTGRRRRRPERGAAAAAGAR